MRVKRGIDGAGQAVAVAARSDFDAADVELFQRKYGLALRPVNKVFVGRNPGVGAPGGVCSGIRNTRKRAQCIEGEKVEVLLDVEWAGALAPGATVLAVVGEEDIDGALVDIVTHHPEAKVISLSFGSCERLDPTIPEMFGSLFARAAVQGQTVLVASGDDGADGCGDGIAPSVDGFSSDPNVTSVGGTALDPAFDAAGNATGRVGEVAWNDIDGASGGGRSELVAKPAYQWGPGVPNDGARDVPDVAMLASPDNPGFVFAMDGRVSTVGGTSVGAPVWAGIVALINQAQGGGGSGALNYRLYALARRQAVDPALRVFFDVTRGDNTLGRVAGFSAGPGYDLVSGLGAPIVDALVEALAAPVCAGDCDGDGAVAVNELVLGTAMALGGVPATACAALDGNGDGAVTVEELVAATRRALGGC